MKTMKYLLIAIILAYGCSDQEEVQQNVTRETPTKDELNISILIDLSNRIEQNREKDLELLSFMAECFKRHIEKKNVFFIHDKIKVLFYPEPSIDKINTLAESLNIKLDPSDKEGIKNTWETITANYSKQLSLLYDFAQEEGKKSGYPGSDIWRFFTDKIHDYCIESDPEYRNILVILTDGYLYHKDSQIREDNRTSYLTGPYLRREGFRNNLTWEEKFSEGDYGFITKRSDLNNLEVLVLEVNPSQVHRDDDEIIKTFWSKWFEEMGVKKHKIYTTDLPSNTKELINIFINEG